MMSLQSFRAYNHSEPSFNANVTALGICMCSTELLLWKNQKRSTRYPMTLQKRDSIADIFLEADLGRGHKKHMPPPPPTPPPPCYCFQNCAQVKNTKTNNINKIYPTELRLKEMTCSMIIAETIKPSNSSINSICITVQESPLRKNNSSGTKAATERCFQKTANPELQKRQITYNLKTLEKYR